METFVAAAKYVNQHSDCDIIDINMGCPAPKIAIKSQAGLYLLKHPQRVYKVVKVVVENFTKPVTVKIRIGWDEENINCVEISKYCEQAGAQGNPWIFKQIKHFLDTGEKIKQSPLNEWWNIIFRHAELLLNLKGERIAASEMRKNLAFYFKGEPEATNYKIRATQINTIFELKMLVN